jgi:hypothetical protein
MKIRRFAAAGALANLMWFACAPYAAAQVAPGDSGAGTQLGLAQENNSGQTGFVTLFRRGSTSTLVVVRVDSEPPGRAEPAHVHRGSDCDSLDPAPAYPLAPVINGVSETLVKAPEDKLLSGNYNVNVHSSQNPSVYVSCGHLYR